MLVFAWVFRSLQGLVEACLRLLVFAEVCRGLQGPAEFC